MAKKGIRFGPDRQDATIAQFHRIASGSRYQGMSPVEKAIQESKRKAEKFQKSRENKTPEVRISFYNPDK